MKTDKSEIKYLQNQLDLFKAIVHNMAEGVCLVRVRDALIVYANPKFERMFGYGPGELIGKPVEVVNAPHDRKSPKDVAREIIRLLKKSREAAYEVLNRKKDGTVFWCRAHSTTFQHAEYGKVWVAVHEDIDERKKVEEELYRSEEKFRSIFENSLDAVFLTAPDGRVFSANSAAVQLTGYSEEELVRRGRGVLLDPDDPVVQKCLKKRSTTGRFRGNLIFNRKDGSKVPIECTSVIFQDKDGQERTVVIARDITDGLRIKKMLADIAEEERAGFSRDLHDTVCQELTAIPLLVEMVRENMTRNRIEAERDLERIIQTSKKALEQAKNIARSTYRLTEDTADLSAALHDLARFIREIFRIPVQVRVSLNTSRLDSLVATQLFLIAREAAFNAAKYSGGNQLRISLLQRKKKIILRVQDNGRWAEEEESNNQGMGLRTMRNRGALINAALKIVSDKEKGTLVECLWEMKESSEINQGTPF
jgi:PAS domain S-box-containing protein